MSPNVGTSEPVSLLAKAEQALRAADASAFGVLPRILRRVIRRQTDLPGLMTRVPHRDCFVVLAERLWEVVSLDELSPDSERPIPEQVILIARPEEADLETMTSAELLRHYWRFLFHARIHVVLAERMASGTLTAADIRDRIDRIGQVEFDEIAAVLRQEHCLPPAADKIATYVEFVAVYFEFRYFQPALIPVYFPSLASLDHINEVLSRDVQAKALFDATRLVGAQPAAPEDEIPGNAAETNQSLVEPSVAFRRLTGKSRLAMRRRADRAAQHGNHVRSAILRWRAAQGAPERAQELGRSAYAELDRLGQRLQAALGFDDAAAAMWQTALAALLPHSAVGFWNANARLLYDLQKACLAHERESYVVDLLTWIRTFGRRPLRRPLPHQRAVLMSKHLRIASGRLKNAQLSADDRDRLSKLLQAAVGSAESLLRNSLRPVVVRTLREVGLRPRNVPERIALRKIIEELLDGVVQRDFLTMGDLRDAVSRGNLKLDDLSGPAELLRGDRLLRADRALAAALDGVYQAGPFYLRWLQRLSSAAFGTQWGRDVVLYAILPFGGAYMIIAFLEHVLSFIRGEHSPLAPPPVTAEHFDWTPALLKSGSVICLGVLILGMLHVDWFRAALARALKAAGRLAHGVLIRLPKWLLDLPLVHNALRSVPVTAFRRRLLNPLVLTALFCWALPAIGAYGQPGWPGTIGVFLALAVILNSRTGREIEEVAEERIERTWHRIRIHFFVALFDLIMDTFKRVLELIEKVLYEVDEWLRFKSGESSLMLGTKAALGLVWAAATFVIRFCVTLLIEPQVNPIKHFPVVTVSHKLIWPFTLANLPGLLEPLMGKVMAGTVATAVGFLLPGVFGFLVWELRGNWRLYAANRLQSLGPVAVGHHGETMIRLLKPGLHSGTLPKLFGKLRRAARATDPIRRRQSADKIRERIHQVDEGLRRFVERELLPLISKSRTWTNGALELQRVELGTNNIRLELVRPLHNDDAGLWLDFTEQSGWLLAGSSLPEWGRILPADCRDVLRGAIAGFYKMAGVDLVRDQVEACFEPQMPPYDVTEDGLVVWPGDRFAVEALYDLSKQPTIFPQPRAVADGFLLPTLKAERLIFRLSAITWEAWVAAWQTERAGHGMNGSLIPEVRVLNDVPTIGQT